LQYIAAVIQGFRIVAIQRHGLVVTGQCLVNPTQRPKRIAAIVEGFGMVGFEFERLVVACQGFLKPARALQREAEVGKPRRVGCVQFYRLADPFGSSVITAGLIGNGADQLERVSMIRLCREDLPIASLGLGKFPAL
jgi:hypothetical protein